MFLKIQFFGGKDDMRLTSGSFFGLVRRRSDKNILSLKLTACTCTWIVGRSYGCFQNKLEPPNHPF